MEKVELNKNNNQTLFSLHPDTILILQAVFGAL
jgi:hypothetical protein